MENLIDDGAPPLGGWPYLCTAATEDAHLSGCSKGGHQETLHRDRAEE